MRQFTVGVTLIMLITLAAVAVSPLLQSQSSSPCISCHETNVMYLDILEGDPQNVLPSALSGSEVLTVTVVVKVICNTQKNNIMSGISATLTSQSGHFSAQSGTVSLGSLGPGQTAQATWKISAVSPGADALVITAKGSNVHNNLQFSDSYSPAPSVQVTMPPSVQPPTIHLLDPAHGDTLTGGTGHPVAWEANASDLATSKVGLYYSTDGFASENVTIATGLPADRGYTWTSPAIDSSSVSLKASIVDAGGLYAENLMDTPFSIDSTPPAVLSVDPANGSSGTVVSAPIVIRFSEPVNATSAEAAFSIAPDPGGVTWTWNVAGTTLTVLHKSFAAGTEYACTLSGAVRDLSVPGNVRSGSQSWSFNTSSAPAPSISVSLQAPSVGDRYYWAQPIDVHWSASGGARNLTVELALSGNGAAGPWDKVAGNLPADGQMTVTAPEITSSICALRAVATDEKGNSSQAVSASFSIAWPLSVNATFTPGARALQASDELSASWNATGGASPVRVSILFRNSDGTETVTMRAGLPASGTWTGKAPAINTSTAVIIVRAADAWNTTIEGTSEPLTIRTSGGSGPPPVASETSFPLAIFSINRQVIKSDTIVTFDATRSRSLSGGRLYFIWDFGDGTGSVNTTTPSITHVFVSGGTYVVTLVVGDGYKETVQTMSVTVQKQQAAAASDDWWLVALGVVVVIAGLVGITYAAIGGRTQKPAPPAAPPTAKPKPVPEAKISEDPSDAAPSTPLKIVEGESHLEAVPCEGPTEEGAICIKGTMKVVPEKKAAKGGPGKQ